MSVSLAVSSSSLFGVPSKTDGDNDSDNFCKELKFFIKLIYILTGECKWDFKLPDMDRPELIEKLKPVSALSGYLSIASWLFAQIPQIIKNYSDKSVDGISLGFLLCWFAGDFLNFTSCLMTDAMMFQVLLSGYYCIIDCILAGQYFYYSHLYYNPNSKFFYKKKSQKLNYLRSPRGRLRHSLEAHEASVKNLNKAKQDKTSKSTRNSFVEIDADRDDDKMAAIPTGNIPIPVDRYHSGNYGSVIVEEEDEHELVSEENDHNRGEDDLEGYNERNIDLSKDRKHLGGLFSNPSSSFTKLISTSFMAGFTKVNGMPLPNTEIEIAKKRKSALDKILINLSALLHFIRYMDSHTMGKVLAWTCTLFYLSSRIPQLIKNYKLGTTSGVSLKLFVAALAGNTLYSVSLLTCEPALIGGQVSSDFWSAEISYLVGAGGTVIFDFITLIQWYRWDYHTHRPNKTPHLHHQSQENGTGRGQYQHVLNKTSNQYKAKPSFSHKSVLTDQSSITMGNLRSPLAGAMAMSGSYSALSTMGPRLVAPNSPHYASSTKAIGILSPKHIRKLSEFTPLSPIDFLTDDYMSNTNQSKRSDGGRNTTLSQSPASHLHQFNNYSIHPLSKKGNYTQNNESAITIHSSEHESNETNEAFFTK